MSDRSSSESMVLNWRGPLLAAAIFAAAFATLLLMAHENQSNASDRGSSLRQDPYGTSLMFDSYERAGYQVERSQDEDSLSDRNASRTTAFFIGGYPSRGRLEDFLARGGRVVLVAPTGNLKSESQGWEVGNGGTEAPDESARAWVSPHLGAMPAGSEMIYLAADAPWLKTDPHWTVLYAGLGDNLAKPDSYGHVYMAIRRVGKGELVAASQQSFLLNEAIKTRPNPVLLEFLAGGRPVIWVDEMLHGLHQDEGVLWLIERYRLQAALLLFWTALLVLLWSLSGDLVRRPPRDWSSEVVRNGERAGVAGLRLLKRSIATDRVVAECWEQFRRRSPHDAQAISVDPQGSERLRAALTEPPLAGYRELKRLISERRASATGRTPADGRGPYRHSASKTSFEEAPIK